MNNKMSAASDNVKIETIISQEVARLFEIYGKSFLDCEDLVGLTGLGRDNVRTLMDSNVFPVTKVGKRKVVSLLAFTTWQMTQ